MKDEFLLIIQFTNPKDKFNIAQLNSDFNSLMKSTTRSIKSIADLKAQILQENIYSLHFNEFYYSNPKESFKYACKYGHESIFNNLIKKVDSLSINSGLYEACRFGHMSLISKLLMLCNKIHWGFYGAGAGGRFDIYTYLIDVNEGKINNECIEEVILGAIEKNHVDMIAEVMTRSGYMGINTYHMKSACRSGNLNIVNLLYSYVPEVDAQILLGSGIAGGNIDIVKLLIMNGARLTGTGWIWGLSCASYKGNTEMTRYILNNSGARASDLKIPLLYANQKKHDAIINMLSGHYL